jgi:hypothetical protein
MKLIALALAVSALGAVHTAPEPPRPLIVLVHGRGQLGADTASLRRRWEADLDSGLVAVGEPVLRDDDVRLAWYADVLDPESDIACSSAASDSGGTSLTMFAHAFFDTTAIGAGTDTRDVRNLLSDVFYVMDPAKRCAAEQRVAQLIDSVATTRPVIIVAYSLGSIVTYDYLRSASAERLKNVQLITVGSPLGVAILRELLLDDSEPRAPTGLRSWVNIYDPNDFFSAPVNASETGHILDRAIAHADTAAPHDLSHYLRDPTTIDALRGAIHSSH